MTSSEKYSVKTHLRVVSKWDGTLKDCDLTAKANHHCKQSTARRGCYASTNVNITNFRSVTFKETACRYILLSTI